MLKRLPNFVESYKGSPQRESEPLKSNALQYLMNPSIISRKGGVRPFKVNDSPSK